MMRFPDEAKRLAMSRAASSRRSSRKPLFVRMASPISSALLASPDALMIIDLRGIRSVSEVRLESCYVLVSLGWLDQPRMLRAVLFVARP
jgi:hypothetical protein